MGFFQNKKQSMDYYCSKINNQISIDEAEVTARKFNNLDELKKIYFNLSIAYGKSKDYELSLHCIQKSLNIFSSIENTSYYVYAKSCEANCYVSLSS